MVGNMRPTDEKPVGCASAVSPMTRRTLRYRAEMSGAIVGPARRSPPQADAPTSAKARSQRTTCPDPRYIVIRLMHAQHVKRLQILIEDDLIAELERISGKTGRSKPDRRR